MNNTNSKKKANNKDKCSLSKIVSWILYVVLAVIFCIFTFNYMSVSCQITETVRKHIDYTYQPAQCHHNGIFQHQIQVPMSCQCQKQDDTDNMHIKELNDDLLRLADKTFDDNVLTFLIGFVLVSLITLLTAEKNRIQELVPQYEQFKQSVTEGYSELKRSIEKEKLLSGYNITAQIILNDCTLYTHLITSSNYNIENHILQAINTICIRITETNKTIPEYNKHIRKEYLYTADEISEIYNALSSAKDCICALWIQAENHYSNPNCKNFTTFKECITPLYDGISLLADKFESYYNSSVN